MPISPIPDLVILLTFTYFIGSLILLAISEAIAGTFRLRPRNLRTALENLVLSPDWTNFVRSTLIKSPHIEALMKSHGRYPAYISASNFVLAIIQQLGASQYTSANLANAINTCSLPPRFKQVLSDLAARSRFDTAAFEKELAAFYNNAMDRAGGWYKRKIRLMLLILGLLMAFAFNIDTVRIISERLRDKQHLALGYNSWDDFMQQWSPAGNLILKLTGILITAFALQLGSSFWFGLLTGTTDLRAAGKKPSGSTRRCQNDQNVSPREK
jgi:hypothetical protein